MSEQSESDILLVNSLFEKQKLQDLKALEQLNDNKEKKQHFQKKCDEEFEKFMEKKFGFLCRQHFSKNYSELLQYEKIELAKIINPDFYSKEPIEPASTFTYSSFDMSHKEIQDYRSTSFENRRSDIEKLKLFNRFSQLCKYKPESVRAQPGGCFCSVSGIYKSFSNTTYELTCGHTVCVGCASHSFDKFGVFCSSCYYKK